MPPDLTVNSVGVAPKSESIIEYAEGTRQESRYERSDALSLTREPASPSFVQQGSGLPVATYSSPASASMAGDAQISPPRQLGGTMSNVFLTLPLVASNWITCP